MTKIGYARVSTNSQSLDLQIDQLKAIGCEKIFTDKVSGKTKDRKGLQDMLAYVREFDHIYSTKLDRLGRNTRNMISIIEDLNSKDVHVTFLDDGISTTGTMGKMTITILAAVAQAERERILERTNEGREAAIKRGVKMGRKQKLTNAQKIQIFELVDAGTPKTMIAQSYRISRTTLYHVLNDFKVKEVTGSLPDNY